MLKKLIPLLFVAAGANALAADYYVVVPVPNRVGPAPIINVALNSYTLPQAVVGGAYAGFDFKQLLQVTGDSAFNASQAAWSLASGALPAGLTLNASTGVLSGTPTTPGTTSFSVKAVYKTASGEQAYQVFVSDVTVALSAATPPGAIRGTAYSYNFRSLLQVDGDPSYTNSTPVAWSVTTGTLPAGLSLNASTGVLSGTPTATGTSSFTVKATYNTRFGQRSYQVVVDSLAVTLAATPGYSAAFGNVFINGSVTQRFTYANTGTLALSGVSGRITGSTYASVAATTCGASLAAAASCTFDVTYHPTSTDNMVAQLEVSNTQQASPTTLTITGQSSNLLYSAGAPAASVFIKTAAGVNGTYLGAQTSTTIVPRITGAYLGGTAFNYGTPAPAQQISLLSSTATTATYVMGTRDVSATPNYTKMVQVVITLSGNQAYATLSGARYTSTALTTGAGTNLLTLWSTGTTQTLSTGGAGYGVAGLTVEGF